jgi:hypothetical protein
MRSFLRSSPVAPQRSRALAEATRLVWQASSTAASVTVTVTVTTAFHGCSARRAAAGRAPAGRGHGVEPAVHHDRRRPRVGDTDQVQVTRKDRRFAAAAK